MTLKHAIKIYAILSLVASCLNVFGKPDSTAPAPNSAGVSTNPVTVPTNGLILGSTNLAKLTAVSVASLTSSELKTNQVVHLRGAVSDQHLGFSLILRDETGTISVRSSQKLELKLATVVDVWGYPVIDSAKRIALRRAVFSVTDTSQDTNNVASQKPADLPVLAKASQVRELSQTQAGWEYPVKLRGVVTLPNQQSHTYIQDDTAGIFLRFRKNRVKLKAGDVVEVEGVSNPGWCVPVVIPTKIDILGTNALPKPQSASLFQMATGQEDGQWIEVYGIVREAHFSDRVLQIKLSDRDGTFMVNVAAENPPTNLVDSAVRIRGVCVSQFNNKRQITGVELWTPSADLINVVEPAPADPFSLPTQPIVGLSQLHINALPRRVKVAGVVTAAEIGKSFFVQDADDGIQVFPSTKSNIKPGDRVEVSGYPAVAAYGTVLRDAVFRITGNAPEPIARLVLKDNPLDPQLDNLLVHVDAEVAGDPETDPEPVLPLQIGRAIFNAHILPPVDLKRLPKRGSTVHLRGVYQVLADDMRSARAFQLIVPSGKDIEITSSPPVWSFQKTMLVVGGLGIVVLVALLWVLQLRRKVAEQTASLQQSEVKFRSLVEQSLVGVYVMQDGGFSYVNPRLATIYGYSVEELTAASFTVRQIIHDEDWPMVEKQIKLRLTGETPSVHYTFRARRKDGAVIHVEVIGSGANYNGKPAILGTVMDITERKEAETKLAEASNLLETLLDNSPDCIYFKDRSSRFVRYSKAFERLFNIKDVSTIKGKTDFDFFRVEHARAAFEDEQEIMRSGKPMIGKLEMEDHADGRLTYSLSSKLPWRDVAGNVIGTFGISKDVTALKEAEGRLGYERDLFHALLESFPDSIYFKDTESRFVRVSRSKATASMAIVTAQYRVGHPDTAPEALPPHLKSIEQFGDWLLGKTDFDTYAEERARAAFEDEKEIMRTGEPITAKIEKTPQADGLTTWCITTKMPWRNKEGKMIGTFGVSKDITALKKTEAELEAAHQRLVETSRLAGMAEVASDVLHNVGNVLNSVNVSCSLTIDKVKGSRIPSLAKTAALMEENRSRLGEFFTSDPRGQQIPGFLSALVKHFSEEQSDLLQELEQLLKHIEHIKQIVSMQQSYAKVAGVIETINPTQLVDDAIHINGAALTRHDVQLKCDFQPVPMIQTEKHRVLQILVNLIRNAKYALDDSKRTDKLLTIRMGPNGGDHVKIEIIDNGVGIPPENLTRIFGHGFTTRRNGHGFGLHSSAIAIKELGGSLTAHSDGIGKGAAFTLLLPERAAQHGSRIKMNQTIPERPPRVLVVDDNPSIHEDFRKILGVKTPAQSHLENVESELFGAVAAHIERQAFRIDSASQGQEAFELVKKALQEGDPYVLAFVDVRMPPGWDGIETLANIWKVAPELQAVICTAYSDYSWDDMTHRFGQADNLLILKKPFETIEVLQMAHALAQKWALGRQAKLRMDDLDHMVRQRTAELRASEERFSKAFQASPISLAILKCDDFAFVDANQSFIDLTGHSTEQLREKSANDLQLWGSGPESAPRFAHDTRLRDNACPLRRRDGSSRQVMLSTEPLSLGSLPCLLLIVEDITEQLKIEAQLRQAQKMEVIGRMAAGIAHEFNNLLTVIQGDVGLLQTAPPNAVDRTALLDQIMQASQRAATFTRQLLAFSRKQVLQPQVLNFSELILRMKKMLGRMIGEKYTVEVHCADTFLSVRADEGGLEQVLMNLVLNARDAMPDGGVVKIGAELVTLTESVARENTEARAGEFVCLRVSDHGSGMTPQVLSRIFDPFFTTKEIGKGTGLGLSTIHGIVKQHEGWVEVTSEAGKGSSFKVFLPASSTPPGRAAAPEKSPAPETGNGETILVVEDETTVRDLASMALRKRGYHVLSASDGPQAIELWKRNPGPVDLLLTDMVMPNGISGGELAKELSSRNPLLKIIYTSGYSPEILKQDSLLTQGINFLPKPYDLPALLKAVRLCLDGGKLPQYEVRSGQTQTATTA